MSDLSDRPMSSLGTPLISSRAPFDTMSSSHHVPSRPPLAPLSTQLSSRSHSSTSLESRSSCSPSSENFHFPILSADGHLLPPPPASSRHSSSDANGSDSDGRPLPSPPPATVSVMAPLPLIPKRWSYEHTFEEINVHDTSESLYEGVNIRSERRPESMEDYHYDSSHVASLPKRLTKMYQPRNAEVYRTVSAEDLDLECEDRSSHGGHRLY